MRLRRREDAVSLQETALTAARFIITEVMNEFIPIPEKVFEFLDVSVKEIYLGFQEETSSVPTPTQHRDIVLSDWEGSWGRFGTIKLDSLERIRVYGRRQVTVGLNELDSRDGKASLVAAIRELQLSLATHVRALDDDFNILRSVGYCCHEGMLTITYRVSRKATGTSLLERVVTFLEGLDRQDRC